MANIERRLSKLETTGGHQRQQSQRVFLNLPDNARSPFRVPDAEFDRVIRNPTVSSWWPDGSLVFDSLSSVPKNGAALTAEQWEELINAETFHQTRKEDQ